MMMLVEKSLRSAVTEDNSRDEGVVYCCLAGCAGGCGRRGGGSASGLEIPAEPLCCGGTGPHPSVQHLQCWDQCAALEVELSDDSFPPEDFGIVSGMLNVKWDRIAPASNVSHTVVLRPLKAGYFNFTSATVSYVAQEGGQVTVGYTSAPGQGGILAQREFDRRFSPHYLDWAALE
ncbi:hypothetical protein AGOR_G00035020 [Albula goreensis]|uniref:Uncharacterized protein n=1 Tax=Albula goreensis TaxID=1534307 RepID=A0A8T3E4C7_9TELE|nr:hypothetical protein AGOR_G00035020 [Albula goreensis]